MLIKDEIKLLHQAEVKDLPMKRGKGNSKKKLIALREVRHMLDEVSTRRTILCRENERTRGAITSMREALASMPKAVRDERAKLMAHLRKAQAQDEAAKMVNENIRESLYSMNLTSFSMPIMIAASVNSSQQHFLCNSLLTSARQHPATGHTAAGMPTNIPILPQICPSAVPSIVLSEAEGLMKRHQ